MSRNVEARVAEVEDFLGPPVPGLMIRERMYTWQVLCGVCEKQSQFKVANWNHTIPEDPEDQHFTAQPVAFQVRERSECLQRYCCHQMRELELGMFPVGGVMHSQGEPSGWPEGLRPSLVMRKPFKCPVVCCCFMPWPFEMTVERPPVPTGVIKGDGRGDYFGKVVCDFKWWNGLWPCTTYMNVMDEHDRVQYVLKKHDGCGGDCVNCCAPSCFKRTHRTYILDSPQNDGNFNRIVGEMQNVWPGWNVRGMCQGNSAADNFVILFPEGSDYRQKSLLMGGLFLHNYIFWERRANQK
eukprot:g8212.t1